MEKLMQSGNNNGVKVIVGLGQTGLSCARYFASRGISFSVIDSRFSPPALAEFRAEFPGIELELGGFSSQSMLKASELVVSPGISLRTPEIVLAIQSGIPVTGDIDIFTREAKAPIAAITGSNGKSTVVTLLGEMAVKAGKHVGVGGNLDGRACTPALDLLRSAERDLYVLELSSFQLETTQQLNAEVSTILNISEDHLDRYDGMQDYMAAKQRIFRGSRQIVINRDSIESRPWHTTDAALSFFGIDSHSDEGASVVSHAGESWMAIDGKPLMPVSEIKIAGRHNLSNAMAAFMLGRAVGLPEEAMLATLREFSGLPHRCQLVRRFKGVDYFNDSKGTNVGATVMALQGIGERTAGELVLIAGGIGKEQDFSPLLPVLDRYVKRVILIGKDADQIAHVIEHSVDIMRATSMEEAVTEAAISATAGDAVLLSPACASFDMFKDFAHRGRTFAAAVEALS
jgi:UDP-N-acetylmuramoylalanine--D-glutamate ligase